MTLRDRCKAVLAKISQGGFERQGRHVDESPVDTLVDFVCAEVGRTADPKLDQALPLVLYFGNEADREEFIAMVRDVKPTWTTRKI